MNKDMKVRKRTEAIARQEKYDALQLWEKELLIISRPGESKKELARIRG